MGGNVIEEHTGGVLTRYVFSKNKYLAKVNSEGSFFYGTEHLGCTVVITDEDGATVWKGDASPFGDRTTGDGSIEAQVKYTGKDMDDETGLYYFNACWYDPVLGRFTSEDPAREGMNWYINMGYLRPLKMKMGHMQ